MLRKAFLPLVLALLSTAASAQTVRQIAARGACSTAGVEGLSAQLAEAQRCIDPSGFVRFDDHPGIRLSSSRVHPYVQASSRDALHRAASRSAITVNSAFRTLADQYVLFTSGGCGLAAAPGRSNHQSGRAVDLQNWSAVRSIMEAQGCAWLGSRDPVHFDCPGSDKRTDAVRAFQRLWNVNHPGDRISEDGVYGPQTESRLAGSPASGFSTDACADEPPPPEEARLRGVVYEGADTSNRVTSATVRIVETGDSAAVDGTGSWAFEVPSGEYTVEASAPGYVTNTRRCSVAGTGDVWCSVSINPGVSTGTARGVIFEDTGAGFGDTSVRVSGASVLITETGESVAADVDGNWRIELAPGTYTLTVSHDGYGVGSRTCTVVAGEESWCSLGLVPEASAGTLQGVVFEGDNLSRRVVGAQIRIVETGAMATAREGDGFWRLELLPGSFTVEASGPGFATATRRCEVAADATTWCSIGIRRESSGGGLPVEEVDDVSDVEDAEEALDAAREDPVDPVPVDPGPMDPGPGIDDMAPAASGCSAAGSGAGAFGMLLVVALRRRRYGVG